MTLVSPARASPSQSGPWPMNASSAMAVGEREKRGERRG